MKNLFKFELALIIIIDLVYLYCVITESYISLTDILFSLSLAHLFLGPAQFFPAIYLLSKKDSLSNKYFVLYFILALLTIIAFIINIGVNSDERLHLLRSTSVGLHLFSSILAHYFVFVLYQLNKKNP